MIKFIGGLRWEVCHEILIIQIYLNNQNNNMKEIFKPVIIILLVVCSYFNLFSNQAESVQNNMTKETTNNRMGINLNLDEQTAIKIAELILVKIYGKDVLKQRPWNVSLKGDTYEINGTFHEKNADGGVAEIKISKSDGRILEYLHWK